MTDVKFKVLTCSKGCRGEGEKRGKWGKGVGGGYTYALTLNSMEAELRSCVKIEVRPGLPSLKAYGFCGRKATLISTGRRPELSPWRRQEKQTVSLRFCNPGRKEGGLSVHRMLYPVPPLASIRGSGANCRAEGRRGGPAGSSLLLLPPPPPPPPSPSPFPAPRPRVGV